MGPKNTRPKNPSNTKAITRIQCEDALEELHRLYKIDKLPTASGAFGEVYKAKSLTDEDTSFAIKRIDISGLTHKKINDILGEAQILNTLDHPNIVKYFQIYEDSESLYIVMEQAQGQTIFEKMTSGNNIYEEEAAKIAQQMLRAIYHCHISGVTHRDIKLENIIVNEFGLAKLIDFGLSKNATAKQILKSMAGTPYYMAPEILSGKTYNDKVDVWSLGVVIYIMLCGFRPFDGLTAKDVFNQAKAGKYTLTGKIWGKVSHDAKDLIKKMLEVNPKKRITAKAALDHPWFGLVNEIKIKSASEKDKKIDKKLLKRIKSFRSVNILKKAALHTLVKMLKPKETNMIAKTFNNLDIDKTGYLTSKEFTNAIIKSDPTLDENDAKEILEELDYAENGKVNYSEFLCACIDPDIKDTGRIKTIFNQFDTDGSGFITEDNIKSQLGLMEIDDFTQEEIDYVMNLYATNDGIDLKNFKKLLKD